MSPPPDSARAAFDRRLDRTSQAPLAVALSGGSDSLALLHLAVDWAREAGRPVLACTVDHGLHPNSNLWTADAGAKAERLGADWRSLVWTGEKPRTGLPAAARQARHALLAAATREAGARVLLMGHTANDVAEGDVMREEDARALGRLREWAPSPVWPQGRGIFILRPLLDSRRSDLQALLRDRQETWLDDPANADLRHPRIRARRMLEQTAIHAPNAPRIEPVFALARTLIVRSDGAIFAPRSAFLRAPSGEGASVLAAALLCVSGESRPPRGEPLRRLLSRIRSEEASVATLCGCRIEMRPDQIVMARAAPRRGQTPAPSEPAGWIAARLVAACGLIANEAEAGALSPTTR